MANRELDDLLDKIAKQLEPLKGAIGWMEQNSPGEVAKALLGKLGLSTTPPGPQPTPPNMPGQPAMGAPQMAAPPPAPPPGPGAAPGAVGPPNRYGQM